MLTILASGGESRELASRFRFEEKLKDFDVPASFGGVPAPRVEAVSVQENTVALRMAFEDEAKLSRKGSVVLRIFEDGNPLPVLVGRDAGEPLEHFVALERQSFVGRPAVGEQSACNGMRVQDSACAEFLNDDEVKAGFGGRPAVAAENGCIAVDFEDVRWSERALIESARCDGQAEGRVRKTDAEVAAGAVDPSATIELAADLAESCGSLIESDFGGRDEIGCGDRSRL